MAGGIPIIKAMREGLAGNHLERVYGILNGTCNYILTSMEEIGSEFEDALTEAHSLGYAEADSSFDVDGIDAAYKLALLTSLAFGRSIELDAVYVEGIREIRAIDIDFARELGFRIKLLAGDKVLVEISPYDLTRGRITYRERNAGAPGGRPGGNRPGGPRRR